MVVTLAATLAAVSIFAWSLTTLAISAAVPEMVLTAVAVTATDVALSIAVKFKAVAAAFVTVIA